MDEDELDEIDDGTAAAGTADATLCCGIEVCRIRFSMKDSAVAFPTVEEEEDISVFSSEVDNGPIDEMCELQEKSICNLKKKKSFKKKIFRLFRYTKYHSIFYRVSQQVPDERYSKKSLLITKYEKNRKGLFRFKLSILITAV